MRTNAQPSPTFQPNSGAAAEPDGPAAPATVHPYLEALFAEARPSLERMIHHRVRSHEAINDIIQEAFLRVAKARLDPGRPATVPFLVTTVLHLVDEEERRYWTRQPLAGAGWHADPYHRAANITRWFDGRQWTWSCRNEVDQTVFEDVLSSDAKSRYRPRIPQVALDEVGEEASAVAGFRSAEETVLEHDSLDQLLEALAAHLTPAHFIVLRRSADGVPLDQVADELHIPVERVQGLLHAARLKARPIARAHVLAGDVDAA